MQTDKCLSKRASIYEKTELQDSQCGPAGASPEQSRGVTEQSLKVSRVAKRLLTSNRSPQRLAKQHMIPDRPKNQQHPMKRISERKEVAQSRIWKKRAVRAEAPDYNV